MTQQIVRPPKTNDPKEIRKYNRNVARETNEDIEYGVSTRSTADAAQTAAASAQATADLGEAHSLVSHAPSNADNTALNETSHADVVVDGDFTSDGLLQRSGGAGTYTVFVLSEDGFILVESGEPVIKSMVIHNDEPVCHNDEVVFI